MLGGDLDLLLLGLDFDPFVFLFILTLRGESTQDNRHKRERLNKKADNQHSNRHRRLSDESQAEQRKQQ
jgi:hypothetical protein